MATLFMEFPFPAHGYLNNFLEIPGAGFSQKG